MAIFHINLRGEAGPCHARHSCPFGGEEEHYNSMESARSAYEKRMNVTEGFHVFGKPNYGKIAASQNASRRDYSKVINGGSDEDFNFLLANPRIPEATLRDAYRRASLLGSATFLKELTHPNFPPTLIGDEDVKFLASQPNRDSLEKLWAVASLKEPSPTTVAAWGEMYRRGKKDPDMPVPTQGQIRSLSNGNLEAFARADGRLALELYSGGKLNVAIAAQVLNDGQVASIIENVDRSHDFDTFISTHGSDQVLAPALRNTKVDHTSLEKIVRSLPLSQNQVEILAANPQVGQHILGLLSPAQREWLTPEQRVRSMHSFNKEQARLREIAARAEAEAYLFSEGKILDKSPARETQQSICPTCNGAGHTYGTEYSSEIDLPMLAATHAPFSHKVERTCIRCGGTGKIGY